MTNLLLKFFHKMRLLPLLILVASLAFMVRIGDAALQVRASIGEAQAQEKAEEKKAEDIAAEKAVEAKKDSKALTTEKAPAIVPETAELKESKPADTDLKAPSDKAAAKIDADAEPDNDKWQSADEEGLDDSKVRSDLYKDLVQRRQQLDQREKELSQREALIKAATEEMNKKSDELTSIRNEIQGLLKKQSDEETANTGRLVKIYEGMKPKQAAAIFNSLDMDVLISVITQMSEKKSSAIIAMMDPQKARSLTTFLSEQNQLPSGGAAVRAGAANTGDPTKPPPISADQLQ